MKTIASIFRGPAARSIEGIEMVSGSLAVGTGGLAVTASATVKGHIPVPRRKCALLSLNILVVTAAAGGGVITAQAFKRDNSGTPADRTLTATSDLTATQFTVLDKAYAFPITSTTDADQIFQIGDTLRINLVAASTVTTQPLIVFVAEFAILA